MKVAIVANGKDDPGRVHKKSLTSADLLIAADGGAEYCLAHQLLPEIVVGDFDSLSDSAQEQIKGYGKVLKQYPVAKDQTDLELAVDVAIEQGATEINLYRCLGGRWDMSFSTILLAAADKYRRIKIQIMSGDTTMTILRGGQKLDIRQQYGRSFSLLPLVTPVSGVCLKNTHYPLDNAEISFGSTHGLSNIVVGPHSEVSLEAGVLLVVQSLEETMS